MNKIHKKMTHSGKNNYTPNSFPFRFEKMWLDHPGLRLKINEWWGIDVEGTAMYKVAKKFRYIKSKIYK